MNLKLTNSQVLILKTLAQNPNGLTRETLAEKASVVVDYNTLGPVYEETRRNHPDSLVTLGLVCPRKYSPDAPIIYVLSPSGEKAASTYSARNRGAKDKVDPDVLNPIVLKIKPLKPYGIENFTDNDVKEIIAELPEEYREVTIDSLRRQIANQRKIGAYSTDRYEEPSWYREYREEMEFAAFSQKVRDFFSGCAVCGEQDTEVYHRQFTDSSGKSIVYQERAKDGILLCAKCHKRNYKFMCKIPEHAPNTMEN